MTKHQQQRFMTKAYAEAQIRNKVRNYLSALAAFNTLSDKSFPLIDEAFGVKSQAICDAYGIIYKIGIIMKKHKIDMVQFNEEHRSGRNMGHNLENAFNRIFEHLHKFAMGDNILGSTTDCYYQPIPAPLNFLSAMERISEDMSQGQREIYSNGPIKFLDLGAGMGNVLYLARECHHFFGKERLELYGIEKELRMVRAAQLLGIDVAYGDMLDLPLGGYDIIHFFNALSHNPEAEKQLYYKFDTEVKYGAYIITTSSRVLSQIYYDEVVAVESTQVFKRNRKKYLKNRRV